MGLRDWITARRTTTDQVPGHMRDRVVPPARPQPQPQPRSAPTHLQGPGQRRPDDPRNASPAMQKVWADFKARKAERNRPAPPPRDQQQRGRG